jgi:biopolymer transport protein ExbD
MRFLTKNEEDYSINLPSMTDIIFLLLIFFMVAMVLKDSTRRLDVQLPQASSGRAPEERRLTLEMAAEGLMSLNGVVVTQEQLEQLLSAPSVIEERLSVVIKADKRLAYGKVIEVMGLCQSVGIADIAVAVK